MRSFSSSRAPVLAAAVLGLGASLLSPAPPATGGTDTLCTSYRGCAAQGKGSAGYAQANDRMYWQMYSGHNCTNYVAYRMVRRGMANRRPWSGPGNATYWGSELRHRTDQRPMTGSVAWWKAGTPRGGSVGHVAYIERVVSRSEIVVSQDSWGGDFSWARITKGSGWPNGFIHLKDAELRAVKAPRVSGSLRVGERLTASRASWNERPDAVRYRWLVGGHTVRGADTRSLQVTRGMLGERVQVRAAARRLGYVRTEVGSSVSGPVRPGLFSSSSRPAIRGLAKVGGTLRVSSGSWSPRPTTVTYQWSANGKAIRRATSSSLTPRPGLVGARIGVTVVVKRRGYEPASRTVRASQRVAPAQLRLGTPPSLSGTPRRGQVLRVRPGSATPGGSVAWVRWLRDGDRIKGVEGRRYTPDREDLGATIQAQVRYRREGYVGLTAVTARTRPVRTTPRVSISSERRPRGIRLVVLGRGARVPLTTGVTLSHRGRVIDRAEMRRGKAVVWVKSLRPGRRAVQVRVRTTPTTESLVVTRAVRVRR
jgi:surface antigen